MKKVLLFLCLAILLINLINVSAELNNSKNKSNLKKEIRGDIESIKENDLNNKTNLKKETRENIKNIKEKRRDIKELIKEHKGEYNVKLRGKSITIKEVYDNKREIIIEKINAKTGLNLTIEDLDNETILGAWLSNGKHALIKVMPNTASQKAIERLRLKVCNESNNCSIELKEVGIGNKTKLAYEIKAEENSKVLFLFKSRMKVVAEVDGETGEIISVKRPWWAFFARY